MTEPQIEKQEYQKNVLPYFAEHLALHSDGSYRDDVTQGIECQHGKRAIADALRYVKDETSMKKGIQVVTQFADAQDKLFSSMNSGIQQLQKNARVPEDL